MLARTNTAERIDRALLLQTEEEINYWREVLKRIVATVKSLVMRGCRLEAQKKSLVLTIVQIISCH